MKGILKVNPKTLAREATPEEIDRVKDLILRLTTQPDANTGIVLPPGVEWEPLGPDPCPSPQPDRAPPGTGIVLAALLGGLFWAALLWITLALFGG
jgi:hypothetical protein